MGASSGLQAKYEQTVKDYQQSLAECAALKEQLAKAHSQEEAQRELHRKNVQMMMQANEQLQLQLKELNGVVERVVQTSLGQPPARAQPKLPASAFPAQAKPGSKAQRQTGAPRRALPGPPGAKPFK